MQNTHKKSHSNFLRNQHTTSSPNLFNQPLKRDLFNNRNIEANPPPNSQNVINSLTYPCCNENMIKTLSHNQMAPIRTIYNMPCTHSICLNCINTMLKNSIPNPTVACLHRDCTARYSKKDAQEQFIQNHALISFAQKLWNESQEIQKKEQAKLNQDITFQPSRVVNNRRQQQNFGHGQNCRTQQNFRHEQNQRPSQMMMNEQNQRRSQMMMNDQNQRQSHMMMNINLAEGQDDEREDSSDDLEEEEQSHFCASIFCRKSTVGFYCSYECEDFQSELDREQNVNFGNQNTEDELII